MFYIRKVSLAAVISAFSLVIAIPARAASFTNGDFGTGNFTGWNTAGFTYIDGTDSVGQAYPHPANTSNEAQIVTFDSETFYNNTQQDISPSNLETQLGLPSGIFASQAQNVLSGSGISQTVALNAGQTVSFTYDFLTNEPVGTANGARYNDFAFFQASSAGYTSPLETIASITSSSFNQVTTAPDFLYDTGFKTYLFTVPTSGTYNIGVGVTNVGPPDSNGLTTGGGSDSFPSAILASNFTVAAAVPEPSFAPGIMSLFAVGSVLHYQRRRKQKQQ